MSTNAQILLRDGQFIRQHIMEENLGDQDEVLQEMAGNLQALIKNVTFIEFPLFSTERINGNLVHVERKTRAQVGIARNSSHTVVFNQLPYIPVTGIYLPMMTGTLGQEKERARMEGLNIDLPPSPSPALVIQPHLNNPEGDNVLAAPVLSPLPSEQFYFLTVFKIDDPGRLVCFLLNFIHDPKGSRDKRKELTSLPILNSYNDTGSLCLGGIVQEWQEQFLPNLQSDLIREHVFLMRKFLETPGNADLCNEYHTPNLTFYLDTLTSPYFQVNYNYHPRRYTFHPVSNDLFYFFLKMGKDDCSVRTETTDILDFYDPRKTYQSKDQREETNPGERSEDTGEDIPRTDGEQEEIGDDPDAERGEERATTSGGTYLSND